VRVRAARAAALNRARVAPAGRAPGRALLCALFAGLLQLAAAHPLLAQGTPRSAPPEHPDDGGRLPQANARGSSLPKTPAEREKMLSDLYALLATADNEDSAKAIAEAIERIWHHSGSATIDLLMERAMRAIAENNLELAKKLLDHVVVLAPDFTEGWDRRAYVSFMRNDVDHALGDLRRTLALDPNHFKALEGLGQILREIGQTKAALEAFRKLLSVHPFWSGAQQAVDELAREVEGQGI
jgi:tetratricopeptide (TPR) repeat protein